MNDKIHTIVSNIDNETYQKLKALKADKRLNNNEIVKIMIDYCYRKKQQQQYHIISD